MSKNLRHRSQYGDGIALTLAGLVGAKNGIPMPLGADGLLGIPETDTVTGDMLAGRGAPPASGLKVGETSVQLVGVGQTRDLGALPAGIAVYGKVYLDGTGAPTATAAGNLWVGWKLPNGYVAIRDSA